MKYLNTLIVFLTLTSLSLFAQEGETEIKKKAEYTFNNPPAIGVSPHVIGVTSEPTIDLVKQSKRLSVVADVTDNENVDNILYLKYRNNRDYIRVYYDLSNHTNNVDYKLKYNADGYPIIENHHKYMIIWSYELVRDRSVNYRKFVPSWTKYTYKFYQTLGWRPYDNKTSKVVSFD